MGIVNPPEVHPAIVRALYRLSVQLGADFAAKTDEYVAMLAPKQAVNEGPDPSLSARLTVQEAVRIGVLSPRGETRDERYGLALPAPPDGADSQEVEAFFVRKLRDLVFARANNEALFADDEAPEEGADRVEGERLSTSRSCEFTRIQAWLLLRDPTGAALSWTDKDERSNVQRLQARYSNRDLVVNGTRWTSFRRWSLFLGLSRQQQNAVIADPTRAVADELADLDASSVEMALVDLRAQLAERLPVLDGGAYREEVLRYIQAEENPRAISPALALALLRAERAGKLRLERRADFGGGSLSVGQRAVTHVVFNEAQ